MCFISLSTDFKCFNCGGWGNPLRSAPPLQTQEAAAAAVDMAVVAATELL